MFDQVLKAMTGSRLDITFVVSDDEGLLERAARMGAEPVLEASPSGSGRAVSLGNERALTGGAEASMVAFSDVPLLTSQEVDRILDFAPEGGRYVVACRSRRGGTNVLFRRPPSVIPNRYGKNSFINHRSEAENAGVPFLEYRSEAVSLDVDTVDDLVALIDMERASAEPSPICRLLSGKSGALPMEESSWQDRES